MTKLPTPAHLLFLFVVLFFILVNWYTSQVIIQAKTLKSISKFTRRTWCLALDDIKQLPEREPTVCFLQARLCMRQFSEIMRFSGTDCWYDWFPSWRRKWRPTPLSLPGESHVQRSIAGYSPWGLKQSDTTEVTYHAHIYAWNQSWSKIRKLANMTSAE